MLLRQWKYKICFQVPVVSQQPQSGGLRQASCPLFTSFHLASTKQTSRYLTWPPLNLCCVAHLLILTDLTLSRLTSPDLIWPHLTWYSLASPLLTPSDLFYLHCRLFLWNSPSHLSSSPCLQKSGVFVTFHHEFPSVPARPSFFSVQ